MELRENATLPSVPNAKLDLLVLLRRGLLDRSKLPKSLD
jgi:hypothetical protein